MIIIFENTNEFNVVATIIEEFEKTECSKKFTDKSIFSKVLSTIKRELNVQKYTTLGYKTQFIVCNSCNYRWQALYPEKCKWIECPSCQNTVNLEEVRRKM